MAAKRRKSTGTTTDVRKRMARIGAARRTARGVKPTAATRNVGQRIAKLAGTSAMVVEWTLRPQDPGDIAVACFCMCGCSCIA